jgi:hypothetical protein
MSFLFTSTFSEYNENIKQCLGVLSNSRYVRYEVLILKLLKAHAFWDVTPCQLVSRYGDV